MKTEITHEELEIIIQKCFNYYSPKNYCVYSEKTQGRKYIKITSACGKDILLSSLFYNAGWITCPFCNKPIIRREER
jgi:hypothetical protein